MRISEEGKSLIKKFEGCRLEAYLCPADYWTIGYGHIKGVQEGDTITQEMADIYLDSDIEEFESYVEGMVDIPLSQNEFDALVCWTFNLGPTNLGSSTLLKVLNQGKKEEVPFEIKRWNKSNGEVLEGLVRRREAEALLFEGKEWENI